MVRHTYFHQYPCKALCCPIQSRPLYLGVCGGLICQPHHHPLVDRIRVCERIHRACLPDPPHLPAGFWLATCMSHIAHI